MILSDRALAWHPDQVHVTHEIVAINVSRMLTRYLPTHEETDELDDNFSSEISRLMAEDLARTAAARGEEYAAHFFEKHAAWSDHSWSFALQFGRFLLSQKQFARALEVLRKCPPDWEREIVLPLIAEAQLELDQPDEAMATLEPLVHDKLQSKAVWELYVRMNSRHGDVEGAIAATHRYIAALGYGKAWAFLNLARTLRETDPDRAAYFYEAIIEDMFDEDGWLQYEIAEFLVHQKRFAMARKMIDFIKPQSWELQNRVSLLLALLAPVT